MALNIKDAVTESLVAEVAAMMSESKTEAVRTAIAERRARLQGLPARQGRKERLRRFVTEEAWPQIPESVRGEAISRAEREEILGYGPEGV